MKLEDFDYHLPEELIAQQPLAERESSRLLVLNKKTGRIEHRCFLDIIDLFAPGDLMIINNTKVIPARLIGIKRDSKIEVELLLLKQLEAKNTWEALAKPGRRLKKGTIIDFGEILQAEIVDTTASGEKIIRFFYEGIFQEILQELGEMPLPPYIKEKLIQKNRYQTVYAEIDGSAAAPTAGLHFTPEILAKLQNKGVEIRQILLHVGLGTFRPVKTQNITEHNMHSEYYSVSEETAAAINKAIQEKRRIIAVGTTSTRTLETICRDGVAKAGSGWTDIFIYPGYNFKATQVLLTNFHLPKSTLIMLVSALAGRENTIKAYEEAILERYRFFSFGDAMLII